MAGGLGQRGAALAARGASIPRRPRWVTHAWTLTRTLTRTVTLTLTLQEGLGREAVNIIVFARSLNVLRLRDGLGGLAFSN